MNNNNNEMDSNNFVITKLEVLTNIELKKEYKKLANQYLLLDENFKKLKAINKNQEDTIYILERDYNDLKKNSILFGSKDDKNFNYALEALTKDKEQIHDDYKKKFRALKDENEILIRKYDELQSNYKLNTDLMSIKIEGVYSLEVMRNAQEILIKNLESKVEDERKKFSMILEKNHLKNEIKYSDLKKKMIDKIEYTQKNVEQHNFQYIDITTKLIMLQNSQLFVDIEHLRKNIDELNKIKETDDIMIVQMKRDIKTHQDVENELAKKNKMYLDVIKDLSTKLETFQNIDSYLNHSNHAPSSFDHNIINNNANKDNTIFLSRSSLKNKSSNFHIQNQYYENRINILEESLSKKKKDYEILKLNYENLREKVKEYELNTNNANILIREGLRRLPNLNDLEGNTKTLDLEISKTQDFETLSEDKKYQILILLMNNIFPFFNDKSKFEKKSLCNSTYFNSTNSSKKEIRIKNTLNRIKSNSYLGKYDKETIKILPSLIEDEEKIIRQKLKFNFLGNMEK